MIDSFAFLCSRSNEREKQALVAEKERELNAVRKHEGDLHQIQLDESDLKGRLRDKDSLERRIEELKKEQAESGGTLQVCYPQCQVKPLLTHFDVRNWMLKSPRHRHPSNV